MALYTAAETTNILHIVSHDGPTRFQLTNTQSLIKVDALNYAFQPGQGGINPILASLSVPFSPDEIVPLVKPATLQLVHVRRQHIVSYSNASRANKPEDLYTDTSHIVEESTTRKSTDEARKTPTPRSHPSTANEIDTQLRNYDSADVDNDSCSEDGDVREVQHMNAPLAKRRRFNDNDDESFSDSSNDSYADAERTTQRQRGIVFHPSPSDRRIHAAIVNRRHTGKNPQTLLQSVQQSLHVEFVASPAVLRGLYSFGFGLGLSIMHWDAVAASEKGMNLWDFSSKNGYPTPPKVSGFGALISSLTALHKFGQHFYNSKTVDFISTAKDFVICYADHARPDLTMARLLAYWINEKFSLFRNKVLSDGLREATKVSTQFCRSDDKLGALRDSSQPWKPSSASRPRPANAETNVRTHRTTSNTGSRIPFDVYAQMPLGEDVRKLCLKFLSKPGCQFTKCSNAHFRPESLAEGVNNLISERQSGEKEERERYKIFLATLNQARVLNQASAYENYQKHAVGLSPPPLRPNLIDDVNADQVQFWSTFTNKVNGAYLT
ncbi:hypothetical protein GN244_ATG17795 [Phytophthora infestans]|uniref:Uncharacterized protein n=1 Tax=Phytophthora infestans TaxID=4787 RepID=A0A833SMK5_PHYIN|nr:hypothetical protein GN244_ATG17795 [Phytophthora infestans]